MKLETYRKQQELTAKMLPRLRPQRARRKLVILHLVVTGIAAASAFLVLIAPAYSLVFAALMLVLASTWTMIRITIDSEDQAPASALDEYQFERLERHRSFSAKLLSFSGSVFAFYLIVRTWFGTGMPHAETLIVGWLLLLATLIFGSYPAFALAWEKPDEE